MSRAKPTSSRLAFGALVFALTAPLGYIAQRSYEIARVGRIDPSLVLKTTHIDYLWRAVIALWFGGLCALLATAVLQRDPWSSRLGPASVVIGLIFLVTAWLLP